MRTPGLLIALLALLAAASAGFAQAGADAAARGQRADEREYWLGQVDLPDPSMPQITVVVTLVRGEQGEWRGYLDIPPGPGIPGTFGKPVRDVAVTGEGMSFIAPGPPTDNTYRLARDGADPDRMRGQILLGGVQPLPVAVRRVSAAEAMTVIPRRPQTPRGPVPYRRVEVVVQNPLDGFRSAGELTIPEGEGPHPAVFIVGSAEARDRDGALLGHRPRLVIADALARRGVAALRMDDRGANTPDGAGVGVDPGVFAADVRAGIDALRSRAEIDGGRVGLLAHGMPATISAAVAADSDDVAFLVLLAPPGRPGAEVLLMRERRQQEAQGEDPRYTEAHLERQRRLLELAASGAPDQQVIDSAREVLEAEIGARRGEGTDIPDYQLAAVARAQAAEYLQPGFRQWLIADPLAPLRAVDVPVLAVAGDMDMTITTADNFPPIERTLRGSGAPEATAKVFPGLNHHLQTAVTGFDDEVGQIEETISPAALEFIVDWIRERAGLKG